MYQINSHHTPEQVAAIEEINRLAAIAQASAYRIGLTATNAAMDSDRKAARQRAIALGAIRF
jgi:superfamily II DNA or RNA helicase